MAGQYFALTRPHCAYESDKLLFLWCRLISEKRREKNWWHECVKFMEIGMVIEISNMYWAVRNSRTTIIKHLPILLETKSVVIIINYQHMKHMSREKQKTLKEIWFALDSHATWLFRRLKVQRNISSKFWEVNIYFRNIILFC